MYCKGSISDIGNAVGIFIYKVTRNKIVKNNVSKKSVLENAA